MEDWRWLGENKHADCGGKAKWGEEEMRTKKRRKRGIGTGRRTAVQKREKRGRERKAGGAKKVRKNGC